jgi:hypothetical protein
MAYYCDMTTFGGTRFRDRPRRRQRSRGQAVVEFALILPVFLLFTLGVVDMARVFTAYIALTNGVSNAAIYAGQGSNYLKWCTGTPSGDVPCPTGVAAGQQQANPDNAAYQIRIEASGLNVPTITLSPPQCTRIIGSTVENCTATGTGIYSNVRIGATYSMTLLTPLMTNLMGGPIRMSAATTASIIQ